MAVGANERLGSDWAVAVSGVAGPGGGSEEKPVGTVDLALARRGQETAYRRLSLPGDRRVVRLLTTQWALDLVRREMGPEATVLHSRELNSNLLARMFRGRQYEIAASSELRVPTRLAPMTALEPDYTARYRDDFQQQRNEGLQELHALADHPG